MTIAIVAIVASISSNIVSGVRQSSHEVKLNSDVKTLNRAVTAYLTTGGTTDDVTAPEEMIRRLRLSADSNVAKRIPGYSGSFVDSRILIRNQDDVEAATDALRAFWDPSLKRFITAYSGTGGIKEFVFDDSQISPPASDDNRSKGLLYSSTGSWIWDYEDQAKTAAFAPTTITTSNSTAGLIAPILISLVPSSPSNPDPLGSLQPPGFSLAGGTFDITFFDLTVTLTDPNNSGKANLYYSIDYGNWIAYSGPVTVSPASVLSAQAVSIDPSWSDSTQVREIYEANTVTLSPPLINPSANSFGYFFSNDVSVSLSNINTPGSSALRYRINGGTWQDYTGAFLLQKGAYPSGADVESQATPITDYYLSSSVAKRGITTTSLDLSGTASGNFKNPSGGPLMVTNLNGGLSSDYFAWGDTTPKGTALDSTLAKSALTFGGSAFSSIAEGERFQIGTFNYYNGTVWADTGAETVDLTVDLSLDINGTVYNPYFDFTFNLINTVNAFDPENPWPDADYVQINDSRSSRTLVINDYEYEFRFEFGETTSNGFAQFNEFHVLEKKDALVNAYGTFTKIGPVASAAGGSAISENINASSSGTAIVDPKVEPVYQKTGYVDTEEIGKEILEQIKKLKEKAETYKKTAKVMSEAAADVYKSMSESYTKGKLSLATAQSENSKITAGKAEAATAAAGAAQAAKDAKLKATELSVYAAKDPALEDKEEKAIEEALKVIEVADEALAYSNKTAASASTIVAKLTANNNNDD